MAMFLGLLFLVYFGFFTIVLPRMIHEWFVIPIGVLSFLMFSSFVAATIKNPGVIKKQEKVSFFDILE